MMRDFLQAAEKCIERCRILARYSEEPGFTTRPYLCESARGVQRDVGSWLEEAGCATWIDAAGNVRGRYGTSTRPALFIGSHLDTVPRAGAFDGILGVVIGIELLRLSEDRGSGFPVEIVGFSEEEGVRFGMPFIGSRAFIGDIDDELLSRTDAAGATIRKAIEAFGLDPARLPEAAINQPAAGYLEFHIEQGPVLEHLNSPVGLVSAIAGQTRAELRFEGQSGHAGTTPMRLRRDSLAAAAEFISAVEKLAIATSDLVATVGRIVAEPGGTNVIPGRTTCSLDVRHADDTIRHGAVAALKTTAQQIAERRGLSLTFELRIEQCSVPMNARLTELLARAAGNPPRLTSGAGHDAMIVARRLPAAMLFVRSPQGLSHHPDETVLASDVATALEAGLRFLSSLEDAA